MVLGFVLAGFGAVAILVLLGVTGRGSVRDYVADHYRLVSVEDGGRSRVYASTDPPSRVVATIAGRWRPADRVNDSTGYFLRYRNDYVVVTSDDATGSRIYVDDEERGYRHWYGHVGGYWGTYSSPAEANRGRGPGAGK